MNYYVEVLKKYAVFSGRARRAEYWYFVLFSMIISIVLGIVDGIVFGEGSSVIGGIYSLGVLIPSLAVAVRRMHDVNKSGWFILIPIYNLILAVSRGTEGENRFGADPINGGGMNM